MGNVIDDAQYGYLGSDNVANKEPFDENGDQFYMAGEDIYCSNKMLFENGTIKIYKAPSWFKYGAASNSANEDDDIPIVS